MFIKLPSKALNRKFIQIRLPHSSQNITGEQLVGTLLDRVRDGTKFDLIINFV